MVINYIENNEINSCVQGIEHTFECYCLHFEFAKTCLNFNFDIGMHVRYYKAIENTLPG